MPTNPHSGKLTTEAALDRLLAQEDMLEVARKSGDAAYNIHNHIRVLTALLAEARFPYLRARRNA